MARGSVDGLTKDNSLTQFNLLFGESNQLFFDCARWWWPDVTPFCAYSAKGWEEVDY